MIYFIHVHPSTGLRLESTSIFVGKLLDVYRHHQPVRYIETIDFAAANVAASVAAASMYDDNPQSRKVSDLGQVRSGSSWNPMVPPIGNGNMTGK